VIHTPGHTAGSISLLDEQKKVLFAGDTLRVSDRKVGGPPEQFSVDMTKVKESIAKLAQLDFDVLLGGHGEPFQPNASNAVKKLCESMR